MGQQRMRDQEATAVPSLAEVPHRRWQGYPGRGQSYADIGPALSDPKAFRRLVDGMLTLVPDGIEAIAGIGIDGQSLGAPMALSRELGLLALHKVDSLRPQLVPYLTRYFDLGDRLALPIGVVIAGKRVLLVDDCLMGGTTSLSGIRLLRKLGATCVHAAFAFELVGAGGREKLAAEGVAVAVLFSVPAAG